MSKKRSTQNKIKLNAPNQGGDRRSRRTAIALQQGLVELLLEKPLREITISEVTNAADVSRTTFYLHYKNIEDLFHTMEQGIFLQFEAIIHRSMADEQNILHVEFDEKGKASMPALEEVFHFISDNPDLSVVLLNNPDSTFLDRIWVTGQDAFNERLATLQPRMDVRQLEYYYILVISGIRGVIEYWISTGMRESISEVVGIATDFLLRNYAFLENNREGVPHGSAIRK
ncbi:MAG: TetR/AcrR family transcriptional regulator [Clostridiales bacterium]|jgi:AcrR family transcriptional regulator|nr:TetR/AcrR family transcriptional regulator [Clostridiales bacterium]MDD3418805.1 TetR/AcrR family transcriptional regulator [Eubacteriales bacterium]MDY0119561.1 TetR/AcrR family transcriptional regulator [Clostridia bacterium]NLG30844.1 TetR/AcrR family transcriptional regulator [Clostridiaceae bacterium]MCK9350383.1 TetR/AcrR family transcriptional regulator [Clostridiales bacterium]